MQRQAREVAVGIELMQWSCRQATAYHEAGHAVVGRVLDLACGDVTIIPNVDEDTAGFAMCDDPWTSVGRWMNAGRLHGCAAALRARIITFMPGVKAEVDWLGRCAGGDNNDRCQVTLMLDSLLSAKADVAAYEFRLRAIARGLVRRHRTRIGLVATALLERENLTDAEVRQLTLSIETA